MTTGGSHMPRKEAPNTSKETMSLFKNPLARVVCLVAAIAVIVPSSASASAADCNSQVLSKPFAPWADFANYTPLDGGTFEGATGWTLSGDAALTAGNEPYYVSRDSGTTSLRLPPRSTAVSPPICIGLGHPTMRFFAKQSGGGLLSLPLLQVDVRFRLLNGGTQSLPIGVAVAGTKWQPTLPMPVLLNLASSVPDLNSVSFAFTPIGSATWQIDDVYVDPSARR